jgi:hypothetical protein
MGWLFMTSLGRFRGPRAYLDDGFTYERETVRSTVLRSALVGMRTYYAAVELLRPDKPCEVFAVVCLVRFNPRDAEGYVFGYKDMTEHMGQCEAECPAAILDLLTPTDAKFANAWRERCRAAIAARARRPRLRNGWTIVFDEPIAFTDGSAHARLEVVIAPGRPRALRFRPLGGGGLYRIGNLHRHRYAVEGNVA